MLWLCAVLTFRFSHEWHTRSHIIYNNIHSEIVWVNVNNNRTTILPYARSPYVRDKLYLKPNAHIICDSCTYFILVFSEVYYAVFTLPGLAVTDFTYSKHTFVCSPRNDTTHRRADDDVALAVLITRKISHLNYETQQRLTSGLSDLS